MGCGYNNLLYSKPGQFHIVSPNVEAKNDPSKHTALSSHAQLIAGKPCLIPIISELAASI